jgi:calcineurin-like phosphoesterase family protein
MSVLFTSDLHLGHKSIIKYRPEFKSQKEHDDYIIDKICSLDKRTVLKVLGDFLFDCDKFDDYMNRLAKAKCRIELVMGNHDSRKLYNLPNSILEIQLPLYSYKDMWISHAPIHPDELRNRKGNIHGHLHKEIVTYYEHYYDSEPTIDKRYFNVNIDVNNYEFVELDTIKEYFS